MTKVEQRINELGLDAKKLSKNLTRDVKNFLKAVEDLEEKENEFKKADPSGEGYDEAKAEIESYRAEIEEADQFLVNRVQTYYDNKDYYAQKVQDLNKGRAKAAEARGENPQPAPQPTPQPAPQPQPQPDPIAVVTATNGKAEPNPKPLEVTEEKVEKKSGGADWLLWGVLGIAGIMVGVNLFKNKN